MLRQLDFSRFHRGSIEERDQFCRELISQLSKSGWVRLVNHGVPPDSIDRAFEMVRTFSQHLSEDPHTHRLPRVTNSSISQWSRS